MKPQPHIEAGGLFWHVVPTGNGLEIAVSIPATMTQQGPWATVVSQVMSKDDARRLAGRILEECGD